MRGIKMEVEVLGFVNSIIDFCINVFKIPVMLYTFGLEVCPWVEEWLIYFNTEYNIDILGMLPSFQEIIIELENIKGLIG